MVYHVFIIETKRSGYRTVSRMHLYPLSLVLKMKELLYGSVSYKKKKSMEQRVTNLIECLLQNNVSPQVAKQTVDDPFFKEYVTKGKGNMKKLVQLWHEQSK